MRSNADHCVYYKQVGNDFIYVVLYVDDMLLVGNGMDVIKEVKMDLEEFYKQQSLFIVPLLKPLGVMAKVTKLSMNRV